ncbi:PAP2 superfamily protein [Thalassoglobus neptunius]|uniref:PAP2 superfamily protein n=1 Tax=Thalassoglobus neptunius TaxID=1938619 RepID=A0A5C5VNA9_9PLAN|nr:vanadium-dependent haloperoxidase [Thalassoglobus neptunius]TWT40058.1 PAP2 superfamily protein [Thalassoglobus neptunius]
MMLFLKSNRRRRKTQTSTSTAIVRLEERVLLSATGQAIDNVDTSDVTETSEETQSETELSDIGDAGIASLDSLDSVDANALSIENLDSMAVNSDVVLAWNDFFGDLLVADLSNQNPGYASRSMAMLNLAIYDAVQIASGDSDETFYNYNSDILNTSSSVSAEVASTQAAYTVLSSLYPEQQAAIDSFYASVLDGLPEEAKTEASFELGTQIGNEIIAARANDGSDAIVDYTFTEGAGYFEADPLNPDVPVWGPAWGEVDTFAISSAEGFAPESTPASTSEEYAASYNEVIELGSVDSTVRTEDQTEAGLFWAYDNEGMGTPISLYNDVLITVAEQQGNSFEENAALFAQTSVAMADAAIVAWHTKFDENFWRPVTAIHEGDSDGNPLTEGDSTWTALGAPEGDGDIVGFTPQFPTYISGHATFGGALFGSLQEFYGTDDISFELTSTELELLLDNPELQEAYGLDLDDAVRSFASFSEAMAENGRSRVYLGIHFDFDDLVGQEVGQSVAASVANEFEVDGHDDKDHDSNHKRHYDHLAKNRGKDSQDRSHKDSDSNRRDLRADVESKESREFWNQTVQGSSNDDSGTRHNSSETDWMMAANDQGNVRKGSQRRGR